MKQSAYPVLLFLAATACASEEAERVKAPVVVDARRLAPITTDLGYAVTITGVRAAVRDLQFTTGGEAHAGLWRRARRLLVGRAHAHPGHLAGGELTGELPGTFVIDWTKDGAPLGEATLLAGRYQGANFTFRVAGPTDGLVVDDPLYGHTLVIAGEARKDGRGVVFSAVIDIDEGARVVGAVFSGQVTAMPGGTPTLGLALVPATSVGPPQTVFDKLDFFTLPGADGGTVAINPGEAAHNLLRRAFQVHDHYIVTIR